MAKTEKEKLSPKGDINREAIDVLKGYVYQIYRSALAWIELEAEELYLNLSSSTKILGGGMFHGVLDNDKIRLYPRSFSLYIRREQQLS